jgi:hypothetical protein
MNREAIERRRNILLLGASDMDQVIAAAEAIEREHRSTTRDPSESGRSRLPSSSATGDRSRSATPLATFAKAMPKTRRSTRT